MHPYLRECLRDRPAFLIADASGRDLSGNGRHAYPETVSAPPRPTPGPPPLPHTQGAVTVVNNQDRLRIPPSVFQVSGDQCTVECWFRATVGAVTGATIMGSWFTGTEYSIDLGVGSAPVGGGTGSAWVGMHEGSLYIGQRTNANYADGRWHHLAGVWIRSGAIDPNEFGVVIDGAQDTVISTNVTGSRTGPQTGAQGYQVLNRADTEACLFAWYPTAIGYERIAAHYRAALAGGGFSDLSGRSRMR